MKLIIGDDYLSIMKKSNLILLKWNIKFILLFLLLISVALISIYTNFLPPNDQQITILGESFLQGRLDLIRLDPKWGSLDLVEYNGKYFWALGLLPSLIITPFIFLVELFKIGPFPQGLLNIGLLMGNFYLGYNFANRKFNYSRLDSLLLATILCFTSSLFSISMISNSWYITQSLAFFLLFLSLYEYYGKRRYWIIGIMFGLISLTRLFTLVGMIFFIVMILVNKTNLTRNLMHFVIPFAFVSLFLLPYNYARFGDAFETGYYKQSMGEIFINLRERHGIFKVENIPSNAYYYFINTPEIVTEDGSTFLTDLESNFHGMSIFLIAPIFLLIFFSDKSRSVLKKEKGVLVLNLGIIVILLLSFYAPGAPTIGPRYLTEILPFAFLLLLDAFGKGEIRLKYYILTLISISINLFLLRDYLFFFHYTI